MSTGSQSSTDRAGGDRNSAAETQALVGLLEELLPLLLQFQSRSLPPPGALPLASSEGGELERQAAIAFTEDVILDALRNLSSYLQQNGSRYPGLENYTGVISRARQALAARDYQTAFASIFDAYRAITVVRAIRPELPPIRQRTQNEQASAGAVH
jgi:hypothetical protein